MHATNAFGRAPEVALAPLPVQVAGNVATLTIPTKAAVGVLIEI